MNSIDIIEAVKKGLERTTNSKKLGKYISSMDFKSPADNQVTVCITRVNYDYEDVPSWLVTIEKTKENCYDLKVQDYSFHSIIKTRNNLLILKESFNPEIPSSPYRSERSKTKGYDLVAEVFEAVEAYCNVQEEQNITLSTKYLQGTLEL